MSIGYILAPPKEYRQSEIKDLLENFCLNRFGTVVYSHDKETDHSTFSDGNIAHQPVAPFLDLYTRPQNFSRFLRLRHSVDDTVDGSMIVSVKDDLNEGDDKKQVYDLTMTLSRILKGSSSLSHVEVYFLSGGLLTPAAMRKELKSEE